ncbi:unnamed protein product [Cunninghamella blakesleeana]
MEKEPEIKNLDSALVTDLILDSQSIIQVESISSQILNNDSIANHVVIAATNGEKDGRNKKNGIILVTIALQLSLFLSALDNTIVSTILPVVGSEFNQMDIVSWVATAYVLTFDAFQPLFAKLSDIFGRKWTMIASIFIFLFGSLLCGVSTSMIMLITARAISGVGAAGATSGVYVVISDIVPLEKRGSYHGCGVLTDNTTWRWCFYINLPIGGIATLLLFFFLDLPTQKSSLIDKLKRIDYLGTLVILIAALLFLLALNFGKSKFAKEPIIPLRLFKNRSLASVFISNWWSGIGFLSIVYYLPIYFQVVKGESALFSGIRMLPLQAAMCTGSSLSGYLISKFQFYRLFIWLGTSVFTLGIGFLSLLDVNTEFYVVHIISLIGGLGLGMLFPSTTIALQASVEPKDIAVAIGLGNFSRLLGATVGIAISSSVLNSELNKSLPMVLPTEYVDMIIKQGLFIHHGLPDQYKSMAIQTYCHSFRVIWYAITPIMSLSIISSLFVKHHSLLKSNPSNNKDNNNNSNDMNHHHQHRHDQPSTNNNSNNNNSNGDEEANLEIQQLQEKKGYSY